MRFGIYAKRHFYCCYFYLKLNVMNTWLEHLPEHKQG